MDSQENFNHALAFVLKTEGGTNDDPNDRGGLTNYGISQKQYPNVDIKNLTKKKAAQIYYNDYWLKNHCHLFPKGLAIVVFDSSVNCGVHSAAKWLQETCNKLGDTLIVDGIVGSKTVSAVWRYTNHSVLTGVLAYRLQRYTALLKRDRNQYKFVRGWINRVADLIFYIL